jgi:hypothetical protein
VGAKHILVVDSDLKNISDRWVLAMLSPVIAGLDMVTPHYTRFKYDGTITNHICHPLVYALMCKNLRQPIGGDFAFSRRLAQFWLRQKMWDLDIAKFGIDIFMTTLALMNKFKVTQTYLGAKIHNPKDPSGLRPMFEEVVGTLFKVLHEYKPKWINRKFLLRVKIAGTEYFEEPMKFDVDFGKMKETFFDEFKQLRKEMERVLSEKNFKKLSFMYDQKNIAIDSRMWAEIVYDCILAFPREGKERITKILFPLYQARNYSFAIETHGYADQDAEKRLMLQARDFYIKRKYLVDKLRES